MDVSKTKVSYAFKCKGMEDAVQRNRKEWCYKMLFDMYFSSLNPEYQQWLDNHIINHSFAFDIDFGADYGLIMFYSESDRPEKFSEMIQSTMRKIETIDEKVFQNLKNRYFGISINHLNNHKQIAVSYMRNTFGGLDFFEAMEVIETINASDLLQVLKEIDYDNTCEVRICPNMETGM